MTKIIITNRLRAYRFEAGKMTQKVLADRVGITRQTVIAIEQGRCYPSLELAFLLAAVFDAAIEDVFEYKRPNH